MSKIPDESFTLKPESTDWSSSSDQQAWFNRFKSKDALGLRFSDFERFLNHALYSYSRLFCKNQDDNNVIGFSHQQEMKLFSRFDIRNDHIIDRAEFDGMCQSWLSRIYHRSSALVIVDVQNDFIDGSLALINGPAKQDGADVLPVINNLIEQDCFDTVVYTQDWHPVDHIGFHANLHLRKFTTKNNDTVTQINDNITKESNGNNTLASNQEQDSNKFKVKRLATDVKVFDTVLFDDGRMEQKLWPVHCIQNSWGAQLHSKLKVLPDAVRIYKGTLSQVDAYSAFWDNMRLNETGLKQELNSRKVSDVFVCGLALDYCVAASAMDSARSGFMTFIIEDACRGIDEQEMKRRESEMLSMGIVFMHSKEVIDYLRLTSRLRLQNNGKQAHDTDRSGAKSLIVPTISDNESGSPIMNRRLFMDICYRRAMMS